MITDEPTMKFREKVDRWFTFMEDNIQPLFPKSTSCDFREYDKAHADHLHDLKELVAAWFDDTADPVLAPEEEAELDAWSTTGHAIGCTQEQCASNCPRPNR